MHFSKPLSLTELSRIIGATIVGDSTYTASGINEIHVVLPGDVTFVDHPKYYDKALNSAASVIIINEEVQAPAGKHLLIHADPWDAFNTITRLYFPFVSSNAIVSPSARIGKDTVVQPGVFIGHNVVIGDRCIIHSHVSICDDTIIGDDVVIQANTVIGSDAFYYKKRSDSYDKMHSCGYVEIANGVEIGAGCTIDRGVTSVTTIGEQTKIDNHVHIGHDVIVGKMCLFAAQVGIAGCTVIEDEVILWGQVGVNKNLTIGKGAIVYAQSGVHSSIEGGKVYFGSPVQEARTKMRELALIKQLEDLMRPR